MGFLDTLFGGGAEKEAADRNRAALSDYQTKGLGYLDKGYSGATTNLNNALGAYQPLSNLATKYTGGTDLYLSALGVNGADAAKAAQSSFTNAPGYDAAVSAGLDAINRRRAVGGMLDSGNADLDALTFGQNLQNQQYGDWLNRLAGINQNALTATGSTAAGQAGVYGSLADLEQQDAQNRVGLTGNVTSGNMAANNYEAAGKAAGAKNLLGAGLSLASLAAGGGFGFPSFKPMSISPGTVGGTGIPGIGGLY